MVLAVLMGVVFYPSLRVRYLTHAVCTIAGWAVILIALNLMKRGYYGAGLVIFGGMIFLTAPSGR